MTALLTSPQAWLIILTASVFFAIVFSACLFIWLDFKNEKAAQYKDQQDANLRYVLRKLQE